MHAALLCAAGAALSAAVAVALLLPAHGDPASGENPSENASETSTCSAVPI